MSGDDIRLDLLAKAVEKSNLDGQTKDALGDDLQYAQTLNGTKVRAEEGIQRLLISGVRRELLTAERVASAIKQHEITCPGASVPKTLKDAIGRVAAQYPLILLVIIIMAVKEYGIDWIFGVLSIGA